MAMAPDGGVVLAGYAWPSGTTYTADIALARFPPSAPHIGSLTANPNPLSSGRNVLQSASSITDGNPKSTIKQVAFYVTINWTNTFVGYGPQTSNGAWTLTFTVNLPPGSYTLFAQAEDSYGVFGTIHFTNSLTGAVLPGNYSFTDADSVWSLVCLVTGDVV